MHLPYGNYTFHFQMNGFTPEQETSWKVTVANKHYSTMLNFVGSHWSKSIT